MDRASFPGHRTYVEAQPHLFYPRFLQVLPSQGLKPDILNFTYGTAEARALIRTKG